MRRIVTLWFVLGCLYMAIEILWRGHSHISMLVVGGLCGLLVGAVNQSPRIWKLPIFTQSVIGASIVLVVEFIAGCILNLWLGLGVWDYSSLPGSILGQVCLPYAGAWMLLMPFAIWAEDTGRWLIWVWDGVFKKECEEPSIPPYTLGSIYLDFLLGR